MNENKKTAFEVAFYAFLKRAMNNPSILEKNAGELRAILNEILLLNKPGDLDAILPGLWELKLVVPKPYNNAAGVIAEIERNIKTIVRSPQVEKVRTLQKIEAQNSTTARKKTADKVHKEVMDFVKG